MERNDQCALGVSDLSKYRHQWTLNTSLHRSGSYSSVSDYTGREPISQAESASMRQVFADAQARE